MSSIEDKNLEVDVTSSQNGRRRFIKRASAGAVVAVLPLKATWAGGSGATGCTVSGNLSGNISRDCDVMVSGKAPWYWKKNMPDDQNKKWKKVFGNSSGRIPYGTNVDKNDELLHILENSDSNIDKHLIAAYLNAENDHYPLTPGVSAKDYARMLYDESLSNSSDLVRAIRNTYG